MTSSSLHKQIIEAARSLSVKGLTPGASGNVSCRLHKNSFLITPTGMAYEALTPDDLVVMAADGSYDKDGRTPSSEWQFHLAAFEAQPTMNALVHTHSNYATALACAHMEIPPFHYMVAAGGGKTIPCVPYAIFGSKELSDYVGAGLKGHKACLMAHHGVIAMGETLQKALELAEIVEDLAKQYVTLLQLTLLQMGEVKLLSDAQMEEALDKFATYGQQG